MWPLLARQPNRPAPLSAFPRSTRTFAGYHGGYADVPAHLGALTWLLLAAFAVMACKGRNPLPFPDNGSRIFVASTPEAKSAIVALLEKHGIRERFRFDSSGILRSIFWDGTIVNWTPPAIVEKLAGASACIGLVADDPPAAAEQAAQYLRTQGFAAQVVLDVEPALPVAFVLTDALSGAALNFRPHVTRMPRP